MYFSMSQKSYHCRWNFSVGQHDVSFVARKSESCDSTAQHRHRDRIAAHGSHHVDESCTKSAAHREKYHNILSADQEDEYTDQCEIHSQCFSHEFCNVQCVLLESWRRILMLLLHLMS